MQTSLVFALIGASLAGKCAKPVLRREIRELSANEVQDLVDAVNSLHKEKDSDGESTFEKYSRMHVENMADVYNQAKFLPWNRVFIRKFERDLQRMNPKVAMPYWDWTLDSQAPHSSPVLSAMFFGGNGDKDMDYCVTDGPFSNWNLTYPEPHCLRRSYDEGDEVNPFPLPESMTLALNEPDFAAFSKDMVVKHSYPHVSIGGYHGDIAPLFSPNDPLFYLLRTFLDLTWSKWQRKHPNAYLDEALPPFGATVQQTLDTADDHFCYGYPSYPSLIFAPDIPQSTVDAIEAQSAKNPIVHGPFVTETLHSFVSKIASKMPPSLFKKDPTSKGRPSRHRSRARSPAPLPVSFMRDNGIDPEAVRSKEEDEESFIEFLNKDPDFVSLAPLQSRINRYYV